MMIKRYHHKHIGQSTVEYAVLLAIVASALIGMQVYIKRSLQARIRTLAGQLAPGPAGSGELANQYEPGGTDSIYTTDQTGTVVQSYSEGMANITQEETITRTGRERVFTTTP